MTPLKSDKKSIHAIRSNKRDKEFFLLDSDKFYLSGYEAISLKNNNEFSLKTVLNSTISFEKELLILQNTASDIVTQICSDINVSNHLYKYKTSPELEVFINSNEYLSHVIVCFNSNEVIDYILLDKLNEVCNNCKRELIIYISSTETININRIITSGIAYTICSNKSLTSYSYVVAKRSCLVKTEGCSSSFTYDLYSYWQQLLNGRKSFIIPLVS